MYGIHKCEQCKIALFLYIGSLKFYDLNVILCLCKAFLITICTKKNHYKYKEFTERSLDKY